MNAHEEKYNCFALCREMLETPAVIRQFNPESIRKTTLALGLQAKSLFITGEGSSRLFPGKNAIAQNLREGGSLPIFTEGATQAMEYDLANAIILGASNSGKTKELIRLYHQLHSHPALLGLTAYDKTPLAELSRQCWVLHCGVENAVAATKSVVEQALLVSCVSHSLQGQAMPSLQNLADACEKALTQEVDQDIVAKAASAPTIYFAGRNDGVAEELTLKTNEITRRKSDYLEGTYLVHGIEEVMSPKDVVFLIDPYEAEEEKIRTCLSKGVGLSICAISTRQTSFPTMIIPDAGAWTPAVQLCAGWNLLVEIGLKAGIDLDTPARARKVGNEYITG